MTHSVKITRPPHRLSPVVTAIGGFLRHNPVLVIALSLAIFTSCLVPPDKAYLAYFDWKTLTCLFCTLAVVCALKNVRFFTKLAERIIVLAGNFRLALLMLVTITFLGSMLMANDMALLTFLPLGYYMLTAAHKESHMAYTFILQNIAANLGGMLTPFGNPQNLYLYEKFQIGNAEFLRIMAPPFVLATLMILGCCLLVPAEKITVSGRDYRPLPPVRTTLYMALFAYAILLVLRIAPYWTGLILVPLCLLILDRGALVRVDYGLLLTFAAFFVFAGNMARIDGVRHLLSSLLARNPLLVSAFSCQVISNVPSAILLSQFTTRYPALLYGVNIGGTGTLIASLASLITFREYVAHNPGKTGRYLALFSLLNVLFLVVLLVFCAFLPAVRA